MDEEDRAAAVDAGNESLDKVNTALDEKLVCFTRKPQVDGLGLSAVV